MRRSSRGPRDRRRVSKITLANLPIGACALYLKLFGWSDLTGRLDASIEHRFETGGAHELAGSVALSDIVVSVPKQDRPALAWKKLGIGLEKIDLVKQHAAVSEVALEGARVVVDPKSDLPVPLLVPPPGAQAGAPAPRTRRRPTGACEAVDLARGAGPRRGRQRSTCWAAAQPLPVALDAELRDLASQAGGRWPVTLSLDPGEGSLGIEGALGVSPLAFDGKLRIADLALPPLLARIDAPGVALLRKGTARADLRISLAPRGAAQAGSPVTDLRVDGTIGLAGIDVGEAKTAREFGAAWKDLEVGIRELAMPGLIGASDPGGPREIAVNLDRVRLVQPAFRITRTQQGILLPPLAAEQPVPAEAAASAPAPSCAAPGRRSGSRSRRRRSSAGARRSSTAPCSPSTTARIDQLDLKARGIRWPGPVVQNLVLGMRGLQGATLDVRGSIGPGDSKLDVKLVELPLAPFNPYLTASGYSLAGGTLSIDSKAKVERESYDTSSQVVVSQLDVGGSQGESLFQENFGIPLSVALGLLKDLDGKIQLAVPVAGDRAGVKVGLGSLVAAGAAQGAARRARLAAQAVRRDHGRRQGAEPGARADRLRPRTRGDHRSGRRARRAARGSALGLARDRAHAARRDGARGRALAPGAGAARGAARELGPARARQARRDRHARAPCASYLEARFAGPGRRPRGGAAGLARGAGGPEDHRSRAARGARRRARRGRAAGARL